VRTPALSKHQATLEALARQLAPLSDEIARLCRDDPPAHLREGGLIRDQVDPELDAQRTLTTDAAHWMAQYQAQLIAAHDLPNLKVGFNKIFGYFIELPKAQAARAPAGFTRRQTLTGAERYITPELKDFEDKVTHAQARAVAREQALFDRLCDDAAALVGPINVYAQAAAELDVLGAFADKAAHSRWTRPTLIHEPVLRITQGRHPVLDARAERDFVPNDLDLGLGPTSDQPPQATPATLALITGPNMAGKSTFIRQTALIVLLAHTGCFVPAEAATIGLTDRIFTRVGADDALFAGQSTFMVEMTETASILHHATPSSLVVLDEIGRGTSTLDGLSLAWAIAQTLADPAQDLPAPSQPAPPALGPRTLFATHYHELTQLADLLPGRVTNLHVAVREFNDKIIFLHRILPGRAEKSFGIQVARLAGVPAATIALAKQVLENLSVQHAGLAGPSPAPTVQTPGRRAGPKLDRLIAAQPSLFEPAAPPHPALMALTELKLETLSPLQAFDTLRTLKGLVNNQP
jgi:DNA mismatch repair protein MutS